MKILTISLDDAGMPDSILVEMSRSEAIEITNWARSVTATPDTSSIYRTLNRTVFNRFWDDGVHGAQRGDDE